MIVSEEFLDVLMRRHIDFFTGVPDSQLREFCEAITKRLGISDKHIIAPSEGNSIALAAGHHLATGHYGLVYMQNSGLGNAVNPITSLIDPAVYAIPMLLLVGWRGRPGVKDEPQHVKQGEITVELLDLLGIKNIVITKDTTIAEVEAFLDIALELFASGKSAAIVVEKGAFAKGEDLVVDNGNPLSREEAIVTLIKNQVPGSVVVSTTGKISRELHENRLNCGQATDCDFLTVGSMGHASMIALQIALSKKDQLVYCLDGDGAVLMHMGSLALIGANQPQNLVHVVLNNFAHESVGGMPTIANHFSIKEVALACGYHQAVVVNKAADLARELQNPGIGPVLIEVLVSTASRPDLIRPKSTPKENKDAFINKLRRN